jgi:hypothetical protein
MKICNLDLNQHFDPLIFGDQPTLVGLGGGRYGALFVLTLLLAEPNTAGEFGSILFTGSWEGDEIFFGLPAEDSEDISQQLLSDLLESPYLRTLWQEVGREASPSLLSIMLQKKQGDNHE